MLHHKKHPKHYIVILLVTIVVIFFLLYVREKLQSRASDVIDIPITIKDRSEDFKTTEEVDIINCNTDWGSGYGHEWSCIQFALLDCHPAIVDLDYYEYNVGSVTGRLEITGGFDNGCNVKYETDESVFHGSTGLRGRLIIDENKKFRELIDLVQYVEGDLIGRNQVILDPKQREEKAPSDFSIFTLDESDLPSTSWSKKSASEITKENGLADRFLSEIDQNDGWEGGYFVKYQYMSTSTEWGLFDLTQTIFAFESEDNTYAAKYFNNAKKVDEDGDKFSYAGIDAYQEYGLVSYPHKEYPAFNIADKEFVYSFHRTDDWVLYGIVFTKSNIIQRITIYGLGTNLDTLRDLATKAANKIES